MPNYDLKDNFFPQLVHVTLKIRVDLIGMDGHVGLGVSEDDAINCVGNSMYAQHCETGLSTFYIWTSGVMCKTGQYGLVSIFYPH
jgi:hypothetical protein